ncbi:MAG: methyltransferase domain-containing protein, partial [Lachnospiraceae bacterium]|nr:methyltransferase domain-containing protein [Lachnospiraceae bacterium]
MIFRNDNSFVGPVHNNGKYSSIIRCNNVNHSETFYMGEYQEEYVLREGDLLIGMDGEFNIARWKSREALLNQRVCRIIAKEKTDEEYLRFYLVKALKEIEARTSFATVKHLSAKELNKLELDIPEYWEQKEISQSLRVIERLIELRKKELEELDNLIKSRFVELFGDPKYNKSNLEKIGEIGVLTSGGTPSRTKPEYFEGNIRWYSAGELNSLYLPDSVEHISETALQQSAAKLFNKGTLMIGMYDTAAFKMGILTEDSSSNLATQYDKLFLDWQAATKEQAEILNRIFQNNGFDNTAKILDCACGIGTQAIGVASLGYSVAASDLSVGELIEAEKRAKANNVEICFKQADFCSLSDTFTEKFDIVIAMDNALPHMLTSNDLESAIKSIVNQ